MTQPLAFLLAGIPLVFSPLLGTAALRPGFIYDEEKVPPYTLPELLRTEGGKPVNSARDWTRVRRPETLGLFESNVYGRMPDRPRKVPFRIVAIESNTLGGIANRKEVDIALLKDGSGPHLRLLLYLPSHATRPAPVFLGLNFGGNHAIHPDPGITLSPGWLAEEQRRTNASPGAVVRGREADRWALTAILARGYGVATVWCGDVEPDRPDGWKSGLRGAVLQTQEREALNPDEWGAVSAWAYGLSRVMDYLEKDSAVDAARVAVLGHSRLGKAALWAGARDERFAIVISNESGCGGAALSRRIFGETIERINTAFPHWFCGNYRKYNGREADCPVDQHQLIALVAPRPVYVASAQEDLWADPKGEFLAAKGAEPVYALFNKPGLGVSMMPPADQPVGQTIGYHVRTGKHDLTLYDWTQYLNFADRHWK